MSTGLEFLVDLPMGSLVGQQDEKRPETPLTQPGKYLQTLKPDRNFTRPSDMVALPDGRLAIRDDYGIQLFDDEGHFIMHCGQGMLGRCYGLATDGRGNLITINQGPYKRRDGNNNLASLSSNYSHNGMIPIVAR